MPFKDGKHPGGRPQEVDSIRGKRILANEARAQLVEEAAERLIALARIGLTPDLIEQIEAGIAAGNYPQVVARSLGINEHTYAGWISTGEQLWIEQKDKPEPDFTTKGDPLGLQVELYLRVDVADATWEQGLVVDMDKQIREGSYWAGHMTFLQRRHPERWNDRGRAQQGSAGIEQMVDEWSRMNAAARRRLAGGEQAGELGPGYDVEISDAEVVE